MKTPPASHEEFVSGVKTCGEVLHPLTWLPCVKSKGHSGLHESADGKDGHICWSVMIVTHKPRRKAK